MESAQVSIEAISQIQYEIKSRLIVFRYMIELLLLSLFSFSKATNSLISFVRYRFSQSAPRLILFAGILYLIYLVPRLLIKEYEKIVLDDSFSISPKSTAEWYIVFLADSVLKYAALIVAAIFIKESFSALAVYQFMFLAAFLTLVYMGYQIFLPRITRNLLYSHKVLAIENAYPELQEFAKAIKANTHEILLIKKRHIFSGKSIHIRLDKALQNMELTISEELYNTLSGKELAVLAQREYKYLMSKSGTYLVMIKTTFFLLEVLVIATLITAIVTQTGQGRELKLELMPLIALVCYLTHHLFVPLYNLLGHYFCFKADTKAARTSDATLLLSAIDKLGVIELEIYTPHSIYELLYAHEPGAKKRIAHLLDQAQVESLQTFH